MVNRVVSGRKLRRTPGEIRYLTFQNQTNLKPDNDNTRPTWAEIDLDALRENFSFVRGVVGSEVGIAPAVKADAYGHGAIECARALERAGAAWLCVALPEEGIELRLAGITAPILSLGGFWHGQEAACLRHKIVPVIYRADMAESFNRTAREAGIVADVHIKIDTGMNRLGVPYDALGEFADALTRCPNLRVDGVMTHFASADDTQQIEFTNLQTRRYFEGLALLDERGHRPTYRDLANSPAMLLHPETRGNLVRPGGVIYGLWQDILPPDSALSTSISTPYSHINPRQLRNVMSVRSRVTLLKQVAAGVPLGYGGTFRTARMTHVATIPIGYHDGVPRALTNRGRVIVRAQFAPIIGRVSMDLTLVDVTDVLAVELWDTVTFIGGDGELSITAAEVARQAGTLSYEITCGISGRVPRRYV
ncbi:MAG: alanine racemase [Pyrinomonadaceae bacterium MAG19_C2-C3]|nr:alanine racemase [Pyrinomonadaceae bacterium MAG19_C2-C3]